MRTRTIPPAQFIFVAILGLVLSGCGGSDLSGYRPVQKASQDAPSTVAAEVIEQPAGPLNIPQETQVSHQPVAAAQEPSDEILPVSALVPVNVIDGSKVSALLKTAPAETAIQPVSATAEPKEEAPRTVQLLIPDKSFSRDPASKGWRVSYDDLDLLKVLNMEPVTENAVELMPAWLKGLDGQRIRLRGFMYPTFEAEGIERFVLARDNQICCFGRDPKIYDLVQVDMHAGKTTDYIPPTRAFDVIGRFRINLESEGGKHLGLYYIEDAQIVDR
ncbi:MAG: hypothetical protein JSS49_00600 [Planctomycetes bacterium]|nr:hypothetical protein [Planctomycetota bacterium]